jgi:hypothetical protein
MPFEHDSNRQPAFEDVASPAGRGGGEMIDIDMFWAAARLLPPGGCLGVPPVPRIMEQLKDIDAPLIMIDGYRLIPV